MSDKQKFAFDKVNFILLAIGTVSYTHLTLPTT